MTYAELAEYCRSNPAFWLKLEPGLPAGDYFIREDGGEVYVRPGEL
jgi:hypothetical protein